MKKSTKRTKRHGKYDPVIKREIGRRYLAGEFSYQIAAEEYGLPGRDTVKEFVRWYRRELAQASSQISPSSPMAGQPQPEVCVESTSDEIASLRQQLREAEQRAEAWKAMIDVASEQLNVDIVKKLVPKPSRD